MKKALSLFIAIIFLLLTGGWNLDSNHILQESTNDVKLASGGHYITIENKLDMDIEVKAMHNFIKISYWTQVVPAHSKRSYKPYYQSYDYTIRIFPTFSSKVTTSGKGAVFGKPWSHTSEERDQIFKDFTVCCENGSKTVTVLDNPKYDHYPYTSKKPWIYRIK